MKVEKLVQYIQSANIHFMIGSGASRPFLPTLGSIETWLTKLAEDKDKPYCKLIEASIFKYYYEHIIRPNFSPSGIEYTKTLNTYMEFLNVWNSILNKRYSHLLHKQVNLFTTNIDLMTEYAALKTGIELNDGFKGSVIQLYDESNFSRSVHQTSHHFHYTSEVPVFNLLKIHGSANWAAKDDHRIESDPLNYNEIDQVLGKINKDFFLTLHMINDEGHKVEKPYDELVKEAEESLTVNSIYFEDNSCNIFDDFLNAYQKLIIVNPTKRKFVQTVIDYHFYELMRIYANSLEIENSLLFVIGFSFADEHIALITKRAAVNNPTLQIIVFAFNGDEKKNIQQKLNLTASNMNNNIIIIAPSDFINANEDVKDTFHDLDKFDFSSIVRIFKYIEKSIYGYNK